MQNLIYFLKFVQKIINFIELKDYYFYLKNLIYFEIFQEYYSLLMNFKFPIFLLHLSFINHVRLIRIFLNFLFVMIKIKIIINFQTKILIFSYPIYLIINSHVINFDFMAILFIVKTITFFETVYQILVIIYFIFTINIIMLCIKYNFV